MFAPFAFTGAPFRAERLPLAQAIFLISLGILAKPTLVQAQEPTETTVLDAMTISADHSLATAFTDEDEVQGYRLRNSRSATKTDTPIKETPQSIPFIHLVVS